MKLGLAERRFSEAPGSAPLKNKELPGSGISQAPNAIEERTSEGVTKIKTVEEADAALKAAMGNIDGGGESSVAMEGGKFVGLTKGVKDNMFRVI